MRDAFVLGLPICRLCSPEFLLCSRLAAVRGKGRTCFPARKIDEKEH